MTLSFKPEEYLKSHTHRIDLLELVYTYSRQIFNVSHPPSKRLIGNISVTYDNGAFRFIFVDDLKKAIIYTDKKQVKKFHDSTDYKGYEFIRMRKNGEDTPTNLDWLESWLNGYMKKNYYTSIQPLPINNNTVKL